MKFNPKHRMEDHFKESFCAIFDQTEVMVLRIYRKGKTVSACLWYNLEVTSGVSKNGVTLDAVADAIRNLGFQIGDYDTSSLVVSKEIKRLIGEAMVDRGFSEDKTLIHHARP